MKPIPEMTDAELCLEISEISEPKPKDGSIIHHLSDGGAWEYKGTWIYFTDNKRKELKNFVPLDWLSWPNAGRLLEEMASDIENIEIDHRAFEYDPPHICYSVLGIGFFAESDRPTRAICEAYLSWKRSEK